MPMPMTMTMKMPMPLHGAVSRVPLPPGVLAFGKKLHDGLALLLDLAVARVCAHHGGGGEVVAQVVPVVCTQAHFARQGSQSGAFGPPGLGQSLAVQRVRLAAEVKMQASWLLFSASRYSWFRCWARPKTESAASETCATEKGTACATGTAVRPASSDPT